MKAKLKYLYLFILPVTLFILANLFTSATIPYFLAGRFDPAYFYLLNSLNLAQFSGYGVGHVDHPGTPLQMLGAVVIKFYFLIAGKHQSMVIDVFHRPEVYLRAINIIIIFLNSAALLCLGITVYKIYRSILAAIFLQLSVFFSLNVFLKMTEVTVENLLIFETIVLIIISLKFINEKSPGGKKLISYVILFSLSVGLGIATKLIFFPLFLIPLLLIKKISHRILLSVLTAVSFLIFVIPAIDHYKYFYKWLKGLIIKDGVYGSGESNIVNFSKYTANIESIFTAEYFFTAIYIMIAVCLIMHLFFRLSKKQKHGNEEVLLKNEYRLLTGIFFAISLQVILIAKHYIPRYMLPSVILSLTGLFLLIYIFSKTHSSKFRNVNLNFIYLILIVLIIRFNFNKYITFYQNSSHKMSELIKTPDFVKSSSSGDVIITGHMSFDEQIAVFLASSYAGSQNRKIKELLNEEFSNRIIYVDLFDQIYDFSKSNDIKDILSSNKKIIFVGNAINSVDSLVRKLESDYDYKNASYKKVFENPYINETVYEIDLKR